MNYVEMALNADFLLFILGIFWLDIAGYIQQVIAGCDQKVFGLLLAIFTYFIINHFVP